MEETKQIQDLQSGGHNKEDWTYIGENEWDPEGQQEEELEAIPIREKQGSHRDSEWVHKWRTQVDKDIAIHDRVWEAGYPNRWGVKVEL